MLVLFFMLIQSASAQTAQDLKEVQTLIQSQQSFASLNDRLTHISESWLGRPYLKNGPLGEGADSLYDQDPLYRTDGFDCTTFVETNIALARASGFDDFLNQLNHIRYQDGRTEFTSRNHFVEIDWNPNNEAAGFLKEATAEAAQSVSHLGESVVTISKKRWYENLTTANLKLLTPTPAVLTERLAMLKNEGIRFEDVVSRLTYLKKAYIRTLKPAVAPAVLNLVRDFKNPNGSVSSVISHQVLLILKSGKLRVRQASSKSSTLRVIDQSLETFAQEQIDSATTRGINIQKILDR